MGGYRESKAKVHTAGIVLDGRIYELFNLGEGYYLVELAVELPPAHSEDGAVKVDVFAPAEFRVEASAYFQKRSHPPVKVGGSLGGIGDSGEDFEQRAFAGSI